MNHINLRFPKPDVSLSKDFLHIKTKFYYKQNQHSFLRMFSLLLKELIFFLLLLYRSQPR